MMRMRLKYVIGGAFLSLAILAAGGGNALQITEPPGVEAGTVPFTTTDPTAPNFIPATWVGTRLCVVPIPGPDDGWTGEQGRFSEGISEHQRTDGVL